VSKPRPGGKIYKAIHYIISKMPIEKEFRKRPGAQKKSPELAIGGNERTAGPFSTYEENGV
jgi:hypothetical protein